MALRVYGIPNCSTVKKARDWLTAHDQAYDFHDFKKEGIAPETLQAWLRDVPLDTLLNRRGTTWRKLDEVQQAIAATPAGAVALMTEHPSLIKRPVVVGDDGHVKTVGFSDPLYADAF